MYSNNTKKDPLPEISLTIKPEIIRRDNKMNSTIQTSIQLLFKWDHSVLPRIYRALLNIHSLRKITSRSEMQLIVCKEAEEATEMRTAGSTLNLTGSCRRLKE